MLAFGNLGTVNNDYINNNSNDEFVFGLTRLPYKQGTLLPNMHRDKTEPQAIMTRFPPVKIPLQSIIELTDIAYKSNLDWPPKSVSSLIVLLYLLPFIIREFDGGSVSLLQQGYWVVSPLNSFRRFLDQAVNMAKSELQLVLPHLNLGISLEEFVDVLTKQGKVSPLQTGSILRQDRNLAFIDYYSATQKLHNLLQFPHSIDGEVGDKRGHHFEQAIQVIIDQSQWRPKPDIRRMVGVGLRLNKKQLTDLDALGCLDDILLIVSCKAELYSVQYDAGDYKLIRNAKTRIEEAVSHWSKIRKTLLANPIGDNYDFSRFRDIIAVVCTPHIVYTPIGNATALIYENLRSAISATELQKWLSEAHGDGALE